MPPKNAFFNLPDVLQRELTTYLDPKAAAQFAAVNTQAEQLTSLPAKESQELITVYTYVLCSANDLERVNNKLAATKINQNKSPFTFYESLRFFDYSEWAYLTVRAHSWFKISKGYLIVACKIPTEILSSYTNEKEQLSMESGDTIPFRTLKSPLDFAIKCQNVQIIHSFNNLSKGVFEANKQTEQENILLDSLKTAVFRGQTEYSSWYQHSLTPSFWHHHGKTGQNRALNLVHNINACITLKDALKILANHLDRKEHCFFSTHKGHLYNHSFDTYLLKAMSREEVLRKQFNLPKTPLESIPEREQLRDTLCEQLQEFKPATNVALNPMV